MNTLRRKSFYSLALAAAGVSLAVSRASAAPLYSTDFESPGFTTGPLSPDITSAQGGWSGGAQGGFTNNDHSGPTDMTGDEAITTADAHSGTQSWRLSNGYNSPGQGTPFTPNLDAGVVNDGDTFQTTFWFKAASATADGSSIAVETGTAAGTDRGNYLAFLSNEAGGIKIFSFNNGSAFDQVDLFSGISTTEWHKLDISLTKNGFVDTVSVSLDGSTAAVYDAALNEWREDNSFAYGDSSRLKFRPRQDGGLNTAGFFIDDISYSLVPEPGVATSFAIGSLVLLGRRRRRN